MVISQTRSHSGREDRGPVRHQGGGGLLEQLGRRRTPPASLARLQLAQRLEVGRCSLASGVAVGDGRESGARLVAPAVGHRGEEVGVPPVVGQQAQQELVVPPGAVHLGQQRPMERMPLGVGQHAQAGHRLPDGVGREADTALVSRCRSMTVGVVQPQVASGPVPSPPIAASYGDQTAAG